MKARFLLPALVLAATLPTTAAFANTALATKNACLACHAVDKKLVGPSYQEVAKKYEGQAGAVDAIVLQIKKGGVGKWGQVPMPAQPQVSDADAKTLATWILGGAK